MRLAQYTAGMKSCRLYRTPKATHVFIHTCAQTDAWTHVCTDRRLDTRVHRQTPGHTCAQTDAWTHVCTDRRLDTQKYTGILIDTNGLNKHRQM